MKMRCIGVGAQYSVYDSKDGRVQKIAHNYNETVAILGRWYGKNNPSNHQLAISYTAQTLKSVSIFKHLIVKYPELSRSLGNPVFSANTDYTQDKVQPLDRIIQNSNDERRREVIDDFIGLIITHWKYGFSDKVFNPTLNNGTTGLGEVILIDFGELTFNKIELAKLIRSEWWIQSWTYRADLPKSLKQYYSREMSRRLTPKTLRSTWKINLKTKPSK
jgi:hypothetical protein